MILMARRLSALFAILLLFGACDPLISSFSEEAYRNATSLKARSLALVVQSGEPYASHADDAETLLVDIDAAYEFLKGRSGNDDAVRQWEILRNPGGNMIGGFVALWQQSGKVSEFARNDAAAEISAGFDYVICLEAFKRDPKSCNNRQEE